MCFLEASDVIFHVCLVDLKLGIGEPPPPLLGLPPGFLAGTRDDTVPVRPYVAILVEVASCVLLVLREDSASVHSIGAIYF